MPAESYEIIHRSPGPDSYATRSFWSVMAYDRCGDPLGVDYHWVSQELAERAKEVYERGLAAHGSTLADDVQAIYNTL